MYLFSGTFPGGNKQKRLAKNQALALD